MFRSLFGAFDFTPTPHVSEWPESESEAPVVDLANRAIGPLAFGAPFDDARILGRPDRFDRHPDGSSNLLHARLGLLLEFDPARGLNYAAFLVAPDKHQPDHPDLVHCRPRLSTGATLTAHTTEADLNALFGPPREADRDTDETVLFHDHPGGLTLEFELTPAGTLKRFNLYPTET